MQTALQFSRPRPLVTLHHESMKSVLNHPAHVVAACGR